MRKKTAIVLILFMMIYCVNVWADISDTDNNVMKSIEIAKVITESMESSATENPTATASSASLKEEADETASPKNEETSLSEDDIIYNVSFPANIRAYLDPGNLSGRGQVFSERYEIENFGNTEVAIKIKSIEVYDDFFQREKISVDMIWENKDGGDKKVLHVENGYPEECVIKLGAAQHDKGSIGYFYFTGIMNTSPYNNWENADISVTFHYEILDSIDMEENSDSVTGRQTGITTGKKDTETKATELNAEKKMPEAAVLYELPTENNVRHVEVR